MRGGGSGGRAKGESRVQGYKGRCAYAQAARGGVADAADSTSSSTAAVALAAALGGVTFSGGADLCADLAAVPFLAAPPLPASLPLPACAAPFFRGAAASTSFAPPPRVLRDLLLSGFFRCTSLSSSSSSLDSPQPIPHAISLHWHAPFQLPCPQKRERERTPPLQRRPPPLRQRSPFPSARERPRQRERPGEGYSGFLSAPTPAVPPPAGSQFPLPVVATVGPHAPRLT